ncbi:MAG: acyl--CoA ligase [Methanomicrobiales archaeon]|nr:acyl--CoA ligase [Methanomicrobiales archaeon]
MNFTDYLFEHSQAFTTPFLQEGDRIITHQELYHAVNSLADFILRRYGVGKEFLLLAENSRFFIICYLAIIRSGNTVILLETRIGDADLAQIRKTCSISAYFVQERYAARFSDASPHLYSERILDERSDSMPAYPTTQRDEVAVIVFTSGTTGAKKGVMLTHDNLVSNTEAIISYLSPLSPNDRICVVLPFYYCYGASLLHTHLRVGGSMIFSRLVFPAVLLKDLRLHRCTGLAGVPSTFQILINKTSFLREDFPTLRYMTQAGGHLPRKYIGNILDAFPNKKFYVMYGATEATARLSYLPPDLARQKIGSIGKGIPGVTLQVVNQEGVPVQPGEVGEITAQGENIMKGYYKDPEGTAQTIRQGILYTGDLATVDEDGFIFIVGRSKNIIKSGGYRISPLEIEDFIISLPDVQGCVVLGLPDEIMGEAVVAVIQTESYNKSSLAEGIKRTCSKQFPSYKIPQIIEFVSEYPLNSSQKIDRNRLREILLERNKIR